MNYTSYSEWGPASWTTQLIQKPTDLEVGKNYVLTFKANTDLTLGKNFEVEVKSGNQTNQKFTLTQDEQTYTMNFIPQASDVEIGFSAETRQMIWNCMERRAKTTVSQCPHIPLPYPMYH